MGKIRVVEIGTKEESKRRQKYAFPVIQNAKTGKWGLEIDADHHNKDESCLDQHLHSIVKDIDSDWDKPAKDNTLQNLK